MRCFVLIGQKQRQIAHNRVSGQRDRDGVSLRVSYFVAFVGVAGVVDSTTMVSGCVFLSATTVAGLGVSYLDSTKGGEVSPNQR